MAAESFSMRVFSRSTKPTRRPMPRRRACSIRRSKSRVPSPWLGKDEGLLGDSRHQQLARALRASQPLATMYAMRRELTARSRSAVTARAALSRPCEC
ncbi:hypothetical protein ASD05_18125 [Variovorax sp. Root434]|nr:hypothetical protein ASD05_18125 [Variovorax sp. Root434]